MNDTDTDTLLQFALTIARDAGDIMRKYYTQSDKHVETKQDSSPVTIADKKINQLLIDRVSAAFPEHGVLGEEQSLHADRARLWVCDPIDGTVGFILGVPTAMFSLGYVVDGRTEVAVMYEPMLDSMFAATLGGGAFLNDKPIHVSTRHTLQDAKIGITASARQMFERQAFCENILAEGAHLYTIPGNVFKGGLVAQGRMDAYIFPGRSAHDIAAEKLIIEEAGGIVTDLDGNDQRYDGPIRGAIISNKHIHGALAAYLHAFGVEEYLGY